MTPGPSPTTLEHGARPDPTGYRVTHAYPE